MVKNKEDSEYSRLFHYNKGLKLLTETLKSEKTHHKGIQEGRKMGGKKYIIIIALSLHLNPQDECCVLLS